MNKLQNLKTKLAVVAVTAVTMVGTASAALPPEATQAFTTMQSDATSLIGLGWPIAVAVAGGLVLIGLFKKVLSRST